jgi:hypothetical protein
MGVHLNHPITAQRGIRNLRRARWELRNLTLRLAEGRRGNVQTSRRACPDCLEWAQARGLDARLHLLEMHQTQTYVKHVRMAPLRPAGILPMPAETNTSHIGRSCEKTLREHPRSCKASGARPPGPLARPHGIAQRPSGKKVPSASVSICRILTDTPANARGLLSGTAIRVP